MNVPPGILPGSRSTKERTKSRMGAPTRQDAGGALQLHEIRYRLHIFVTAAGEVHDHEMVLRHFGRAFDASGDGVRRFQRGDNSLLARQLSKSVQRLIVCGVGILDSYFIVQPGVLGADGSVVESSGDGVGKLNLPVVVLENV